MECAELDDSEKYAEGMRQPFAFTAVADSTPKR